MVDIADPATNTAVVSEGTPQLTINHEAVVDLDSSNAFEGPEKLLEVWFAPSADKLPAGAHRDGLKAVSAEVWKEMLDVVNCKVLSIVESDHVDAYLLSESSMFVFSHKLILKTCGTTTLLWGLPHILDIAAAKAGFAHHRGSNVKGTETAATPYRVFYSRKNFLFPDRQRGPHRSWNDEVQYLDKMFWGGSAYMVGKMNGDHWYLYLTSPNTEITPPQTPETEKPTETKVLSLPGEAAPNNASGNDDETLEVLMTDLDVEKAKQFYLDNASALAESNFYKQQKLADQESTPDAVPVPSELTTEGHALGTVVSESCGLSALYPPSRYPDARVDAYLFTPCGFSANGVIPAPEAPGVGPATHYFTVHVTPEPQCSYASFETNVPGQQTGVETAEVIEQVVGIFAPGRFSVTLFEGKECGGGELKALDAKVEGTVATSGSGKGVVNGEVKGKGRGRMDAIRGYRRVERIVHEFDGYDLVFHYYERDDWKGGAPVVGEVM
ncbi:hypothetical protein V494_03250 [Pseudogymnoascus sp. VKM F-4513 (FW-928)]|nr:hypothetical protein V494_03250 [Pseudogymnoascus sp. VKM F-4513 (FW-928)]